VGSGILHRPGTQPDKNGKKKGTQGKGTTCGSLKKRQGPYAARVSVAGTSERLLGVVLLNIRGKEFARKKICKKKKTTKSKLNGGCLLLNPKIMASRKAGERRKEIVTLQNCPAQGPKKRWNGATWGRRAESLLGPMSVQGGGEKGEKKVFLLQRKKTLQPQEKTQNSYLRAKRGV